MALSSNQYALKGQRLEKILGKKGSKSSRMNKLWQFWQGHPKPAFSEKVQRGDQGKFFKNRPKSSPRLKGPKALCRRWHYPRTSMLLRCKDWETFWFKQRLQKFPNGQVMAILAKSFKTRIFQKKGTGGPRKIFQKSSKKQTSFERPKSTLAQMALSSNQYALKGQRLEKILGQKSGSKTSRMTKLWQFWQGHPKPAFSEKVQRGYQGKFFKNRPKTSPRLKGPKAFWRKLHSTLISMHL